MEKTLVFVKPDGIRRKLVGEIIHRLENKDLTLEAAKLLILTRDMAEEHYQEHRSKLFFSDLITYICSGPILAMIWSGSDAIAQTRLLVGHRSPVQALPGTIRGDYAHTTTENLVHASDCSEAAVREIALFFGDPSER